jgi:hypothetical protein
MAGLAPSAQLLSSLSGVLKHGRPAMREFWALVMICATVFAAFATAMLVVSVQTGSDRDLAGITVVMAIAGWVVAYWAYRFLTAIPKKKEDIW